MNVDVVLATYNGAAYISKLLDSLLSQTVACRILVHDDGSQDATMEILKDYVQHYPDKIKILQHSSFGNARDNFSFLLENTTNDYVFCADQDDIWEPQKIEVMLNIMKLYEEIEGKTFPLLLHSDLMVIDANDAVLSKSFWAYQNLDPKWGNNFKLILTQNVVTGCAVMVNRALLNVALPIPKEAEMHDWWMAIVAASFGKIFYILEPLTRYRKHDSNVIGAKKFDLNMIINKIRGLSDVSDSRVAAAQAIESSVSRQAEEFVRYFPGSRDALDALSFSRLHNLPYFERISEIYRFGFFQKGLVRNAVWIIKPRETIAKVKRSLQGEKHA